MKKRRKSLFLVLTALVLSFCLLAQCAAELPGEGSGEAKEAEVSVKAESDDSSALAISMSTEHIETGSGLPWDPSGVTVDVTNVSGASASSGEGEGGANATAISNTTVTINTHDSTPPFWPIPVPPAPAPHHHHSTGGGTTKVKIVETIVSSEPVIGTGFTLKAKVNVRASASIYSTRVAVIRNSGTVMEITAKVINSSGEIWYAVKLYNGTLGYILGSLLHVEIKPVEEEEEDKTEKVIVQYVYVTPEPVVEVTPEVIYVPLAESAVQATPTPIIVYVTPEPPGYDPAEEEDEDSIVNG